MTDGMQAWIKGFLTFITHFTPTLSVDPNMGERFLWDFGQRGKAWSVKDVAGLERARVDSIKRRVEKPMLSIRLSTVRPVRARTPEIEYEWQRNRFWRRIT